MVLALLRSNPAILLAFCNKNATVTLTIGCMCPAEGAAALSCDIVYNSDYNADRPITNFPPCSDFSFPTFRLSDFFQTSLQLSRRIIIM